MSSIAKMIQIVLSSGELRPDRQALCSRILQKLHRISGEELINSHQCEFMLHRLRNQQAIKRITVEWVEAQSNEPSPPRQLAAPRFHGLFAVAEDRLKVEQGGRVCRGRA